MSTLSSVPEDDAKAKAGLSTRKIVDELKTAALLGTDVTYEVLADYIRHKTQSLINQQIKSVLDEALANSVFKHKHEAEEHVVDYKNGYNDGVEAAEDVIKEIRSRYE